MNVAQSDTQQSQRPLCVDLDGTLIRSDLLFENLFSMFRSGGIDNVSKVFRASVQVFSGGPHHLKSAIVNDAEIDVSLLPYNQELISYIEGERAKGRPTVLITASHQQLADAIAQHLGLFDVVLGSDSSRNLKGRVKAELLEDQYPDYEYVGDSVADFPVWDKASAVGVVARSGRVVQSVKSRFSDPKIFNAPSRIAAIPKALRVHQWVKNLLLFVPLFMAHRIFEASALFHAAIGFTSFCLVASSVYILNDLFDLENDRVHPSKSKRPFAAGLLMPQEGILFVGGLLLTAFALAFFLPFSFIGVLIVYLSITSAYSIALKKMAVLDIVILASLYTVRIIAGGAATGIAVSEWLLAFSMFMFLSLACIKRFSELARLKGTEGESEDDVAAKGRGYRASDLEQIAMFGSTSGYLSVLVLALYINSPAVMNLYAAPQMLWLLCPAVLYWVTRVWLLARRNQVNEDPLLFALHDRTSYFVLGVALLIVLLAK